MPLTKSRRSRSKVLGASRPPPSLLWNANTALRTVAPGNIGKRGSSNRSGFSSAKPSGIVSVSIATRYVPGPGTSIAHFPSASLVASPEKFGSAATSTADAVTRTPSIGFEPLANVPMICGDAAAGAVVVGAGVVGVSCAPAGPIPRTRYASRSAGPISNERRALLPTHAPRRLRIGAAYGSGRPSVRLGCADVGRRADDDGTPTHGRNGRRERRHPRPAPAAQSLGVHHAGAERERLRRETRYASSSPSTSSKLRRELFAGRVRPPRPRVLLPAGLSEWLFHDIVPLTDRPYNAQLLGILILNAYSSRRAPRSSRCVPAAGSMGCCSSVSCSSSSAAESGGVGQPAFLLDEQLDAGRVRRPIPDVPRRRRVGARRTVREPADLHVRVRVARPWARQLRRLLSFRSRCRSRRGCGGRVGAGTVSGESRRRTLVVTAVDHCRLRAPDRARDDPALARRDPRLLALHLLRRSTSTLRRRSRSLCALVLVAGAGSSRVHSCSAPRWPPRSS